MEENFIQYNQTPQLYPPQGSLQLSGLFSKLCGLNIHHRMKPRKNTSREFDRLVRIIRRLRKECPWDREQTHASIRDMLIEEAYEVIETIDERDWDGLEKELGDILLHVLMHAVIAEERGSFTLDSVLSGLSGKLIRRHPHVFGTRSVRNASDVRRNWEEIKMSEGRTSVLDGIPRGLPALQQAMKLQERAARVGFDWKHRRDVLKKVKEELRELEETLHTRSRRRREEELGDFLFALVNYARFIGINPESALRLTIRTFIERFQYIEHEVSRSGRRLSDASLAEMDTLWEKAKTLRKKRRVIRR